MSEPEIFETHDRPTPRPATWAVDCPSCGEELPYSPAEDDSGAWRMDPAEWPVCKCGCMFAPETIAVIEIREGA